MKPNGTDVFKIGIVLSSMFELKLVDKQDRSQMVVVGSGSKLECRWCNSNKVLKIAVGAKARWIVESPSTNEISNLLCCEDCGLVYFSASFSDDELTRMYSG